MARRKIGWFATLPNSAFVMRDVSVRDTFSSWINNPDAFDTMLSTLLKLSISVSTYNPP